MKKICYLITGILIGGVLLNGNAINAAAGLWAERSMQPVYVDGQKVELEAYNIAGANYVKLRDIGEAVSFNVYYWNGSVQVDSGAPYTGEPRALTAAPKNSYAIMDGTMEESPQAIIPDYSAQANPAIFTGTYTREMYNALRQAILTKADSQPFAFYGEEMKQTCWNVTAANSIWPSYELVSDGHGRVLFTLIYSSTYQPAYEYCQPFINSLDGKSDREKVKAIAFFVCDRLQYKAGTTSAPNTALIDNNAHYGNCMSYAHNFKFLCDMAGIPCIFTHSSIHQWNQVYLEGIWWGVDVTGTDIGYSESGNSRVLYEEGYLQGDMYRQTQPELTVFAKETLVPGSTK